MRKPHSLRRITLDCRWHALPRHPQSGGGSNQNHNVLLLHNLPGEQLELLGDGELRLNGNVDLGDASTDIVDIPASFRSLYVLHRGDGVCECVWSPNDQLPPCWPCDQELGV